MKEYKGVVFFDVDGTLIDYSKGIKAPTEKTKESIKKLQESGYLTILATGRPMSFVTEELLNLGLSGYIASNGSYAEIEGEIIFNYPIENSKLKNLLGFFNENKIEYILEGQKESYVADINGKGINKLIEEIGLKKEAFTDNWDVETVKTNKLVVNCENMNICKIIKGKYGHEYVFIHSFDEKNFEMFIGKYTKGYGVEQLINKLGIDQKDTYAFGDGENDIEMFQVVKHGIAMGGYHKGLKEYAYDFTENVENEGIYKGLKKLGLI